MDRENRERTRRLPFFRLSPTTTHFPILKRAGLNFAVCYEDRTVGDMAAKNTLGERSSEDYVKSSINWLNENWFQDESYLRLDSRPVLGVFGPMHLRGNWTPISTTSKSSQ